MQQLLAGYLLNAAWQIPLVALCAFAISRFAGLSPAGRNRLWLAFVVAAVILPAVALDALLPHIGPTVARLPAGATFDTAALASASLAAAADPAIAFAPVSIAPFLIAPWAVWAMTMAAAAVAFLLIVRLLAASAAARRLVRQAAPVTLPADITQAVGKLAAAHGHKVPPILSSTRVASPAVVGAFTPVILIPDDMARCGEDLRAALLHEMAHVIRHDYAINVACEVLTLPVAWHPATLGLKAGVRRSRELACDAIAASAMGSPKAYARRLISLAQTLSAPAATPANAPLNASLAVGLFGRSDLEDRLMQLMKPRDAETPAIRAARFCGLAAVGASLLGSAALLHVTPVFAQPAPATPVAVAAAPLAPAVPATPARAATPAAPATPASPAAPASPATPVHHHSGLIFSRNGVIIDAGHNGYAHSFTSSTGEPITVYTDDAKAPSADQQREWETAARDAEAHAAAAEKLVNSPEFKARIEKAQARAAEAERMVNSPEFKARMAKAQEQAAAAEKLVNSPEFKARIAKAEAEGAAAEKLVNSPEFKARIAKAQARAAEAEKMINSPEFKARMARAQAEAAIAPERMRASLERAQAEIQRQLDDLAKPEDTPSHAAP